MDRISTSLYRELIQKAVAENDESFFNYLLERFTISDHWATMKDPYGFQISKPTKGGTYAI